MPRSGSSKRPAGGSELPARRCQACGREMRWRKKWARNWGQVRYCSDACRARGREGAVPTGRPAEARIEAKIVELLAGRGVDSTICPSEVARALWPSVRAGVDPWRAHMPEVHAAAARLAQAGRIELTQGGERVDPLHLRGPRRLRRGERFDDP